MKKTKIVCTLGPSTYGEQNILQLYKSGANIVRFNFSHADYQKSKEQIDTIMKLNLEGKTNLSILLDTKGPEIRTGDVEKEREYSLGDIFKIYVSHGRGGDKDLFCDYESLSLDLEEGDIVSIDSGLFNVKVLSKGEDFIEVEAMNNSTIGSRRHVNLPGVKLRLPGVTERDKKDILFAIENKFHFIAPSFIRNASNVEEIRQLLAENKAEDIKIISKIENQEGIENMEEIIKSSDGVMVARGDLGIEVPIEKLPMYQKQMVETARYFHKQVIVATHFLESMVDNPFPTRAESSDVFNAVQQSPDAVMLSGETAMGGFPFESVKIMSRIIKEAEKIVAPNYEDYSDWGLTKRDKEKNVLIKNALRVGEELGAKAIILLTKTGRLARLASLYRSKMDIFAFTGSAYSKYTMNLLFGVKSKKLDSWDSGNYEMNLENAIKFLVEKKNLDKDNLVIAINDIQRGGKEIPIMSVINLEDYI